MLRYCWKIKVSGDVVLFLQTLGFALPLVRSVDAGKNWEDRDISNGERLVLTALTCSCRRLITVSNLARKLK